MSDRINLAAVRANIERQDFDAVPDETVLALLDAVEAAHDVAWVLDCRCDEAYTARGLHGPWCRFEDGENLRAALARFDFGESA